tara:strand:+ start:3418 stop:4314 length:897 start_codon:yes stop_codon:yes gene_type:complete
MKISVIMPMYNSEKTVIRAIDSLKNQTYKNFELIIVDDKSSDRSLTLVEAYDSLKDKLIIVKLENNSGVNVARNQGLDVVSVDSSIVTFLDSDDEFVETALEDMVSVINENNSYLDYCFAVVDHQNKPCSFLGGREQAYDYKNIVSNRKLISGEWVHAIKTPLIFDRTFRYDERVKNGFESLAYLRLARSNDVYYSKKVVRKYYTDNESLTRTNSYSKERVKDLCNGYQLLLQEHEVCWLNSKVEYSKLLSVFAHFSFLNKDYIKALKLTFIAFTKNPLELRVYRNLMYLVFRKYSKV